MEIDVMLVGPHHDQLSDMDLIENLLKESPEFGLIAQIAIPSVQALEVLSLDDGPARFYAVEWRGICRLIMHYIIGLHMGFHIDSMMAFVIVEHQVRLAAMKLKLQLIG